MELINALRGVEKYLGCVFLLWAMEDGVQRMFNKGKRLRKSEEHTGQLFGLVPFSYMVGTDHVLRSNIAIHPFSVELPLPLHRFYINPLYISWDEMWGTTSTLDYN